MTEKLAELERLMLSVRDFGWDDGLDDDAPVRARSACLRRFVTEQHEHESGGSWLTGRCTLV
jgi:hypothetical protein